MTVYSTAASQLLDPGITMLLAGSVMGRLKAVDLQSGRVIANVPAAHSGQLFSMYEM